MTQYVSATAIEYKYFVKFKIWGLPLQHYTGWLDENMPKENHIWGGNGIIPTGVVFLYEEDSVAFKLRFGL